MGSTELQGKSGAMCMLNNFSPAFCDPMVCSPPGSSVHGILQVSILEWVALPSSRGGLLIPGTEPSSYISCTGSLVHYH